jgi:SAM-dependent methyltransferase
MSLFTRGFLALLEQIRDDEIHTMLPQLGSPGRLLEIGAGSGWQAKFLTEHGYAVDAIDVGTSEYREVRVWPVTEYDGYTIPFPDASFDVVFSSNVMEHIPHVRQFQSEILRVLRPGGIAVHAMPSATWRLLTTLAFYPWMFSQVAHRLTKGGGAPHIAVPPTPTSPARAPERRSVSARIRGIVSSPRHGETGTMLSEFWLFSKPRWTGLFRDAGFASVTTVPLRVSYSGYLVFGTAMSFDSRRRMSRLVGSSCIAYTMRKPMGAA